MHFIQMKKINSLAEFHAEKQRLEREIKIAEAILKEDLNWAKEELKPEKVVSAIFNSYLKKNIGGLFKNGTGNVLDFLLRNVVLSKAGWIKRLIIPLIAKNVSSGLISDNKEEILGILKNLVHKARQYTQHNQSPYSDRDNGLDGSDKV